MKAFVTKIIGGVFALLLTPFLIMSGARADARVNPFVAPPNFIGHFIVQKIDYLLIQDSHLISNPWTGNFNALNGKAYQLSAFYKNQRALEMNLKTGIELVKTARMKISLPVHFDNGYQADLYDAERFLGLGLSVYYVPHKDWFLSLNMTDIIQFGGAITERPCYDGFRREFHCGTGQAWSDVKGNLNQQRPSEQIKIRILYLF